MRFCPFCVVLLSTKNELIKRHLKCELVNVPTLLKLKQRVKIRDLWQLSLDDFHLYGIFGVIILYRICFVLFLFVFFLIFSFFFLIFFVDFLFEVSGVLGITT